MNYFAPTTLDEALRLCTHENSDQRPLPLAGGTDLVVQLSEGRRESPAGGFLSLRNLEELRGISIIGDLVEIGALTTIAEIADEKVLCAQVPILQEVATCFAGDQIRHAATLGGNLCNGSPAGDMAIPLLLLDGEVELASWSRDGIQRRWVSLDRFFLSPGKTERMVGEILTKVRFRLPKSEKKFRFEKMGTRKSMDIAIVSVGFATLIDQGKFRECRLAFGAVAPTPIRAKSLEALIDGRAVTSTSLSDLISEITKKLPTVISPISDGRASAWYREELVKTLVARMVSDVI